MAEEMQQVVPLSLDQLVLGENIRWKPKQHQIENLAKQIQEMGGIHTPLKVEPHDANVYMIREGEYRYRAALWLKQHGVSITLPCIIEPVTATKRERIYKQLSENQDRENMSPLDTGNTIHMLLEEGVTRTEIMKRLSRPGGPGKTPIMVPLSEAAYSYYVRYRELPPEAQQMLHDGTLHATAANRILDENNPQKRAQLLADAEKKRQERLAQEEEKNQELEKLKAEAEKRQATLATNREIVDTKTKEIGELEKAYLEKKKVSEAAFKTIGNLKGEKRDAANKAYRAKADETDEVKLKLAAAKKVRNEALNKVQMVAASQRRVEVAERTQKARTALMEKDVLAARADQNGRSKLGALDMRAAVKNWTEAPFPKVQAIGAIIDKTFESILTANQARRAMAKVTGEIKQPKKEPVKTISRNGRRGK